jgi:hypothetical protein
VGSFSEPALKSGAFFRTSRAPIEILVSSLPMKPQLLADGAGEIEHPSGVWLREPVKEMTILAEQYDFSISLLLLQNSGPSYVEDAAPTEDTYDRFAPPAVRREW